MDTTEQRKKDDWRLEANCANLSPEMIERTFFPKRGRPARWPAYKQFCGPCPVARECLNYAIVHQERGIWGGTTSEERAVIPKSLVRDYQDQAREEGWMEETRMPLLPNYFDGKQKARQAPLENLDELDQFLEDLLA